MPEIFAYTITRAESDDRIQLLLNTLTQARSTAGIDFYWLVITNGSKRAADLCRQTGLVNSLLSYETNCGQHVATNDALRMAKQFEDVKYVLRLDDDVEFLTKKWLRRLIEASIALEDKFVLSPKVRGLKNPPAVSAPSMVRGIRLEFLTEAIGGICRLHPLDLIEDYQSDVRSGMGSGDATGMAGFCQEKIIPMAYVSNVRVKHAKSTKQQELDDTQHFSMHDLFQAMPYIPVRKSDV